MNYTSRMKCPYCGRFMRQEYIYCPTCRNQVENNSEKIKEDRVSFPTIRVILSLISIIMVVLIMIYLKFQ